MTIQLIESWATYATTADIIRRWVYQYGNGGALSGNACLVDGSVVSYCNTHLYPVGTIQFGVWFTPLSFAPTVQNSSFIHTLSGGETNANNQVGFGANPNGTISCFVGPNFSGYGGTTVANGTTVLTAGTAYWLEVNIVCRNGTAGSVELRINGNPEFTVTGLNTNPVGSGPWIYGFALVAGAGTQHLFGGLYIGDGAEGWLGPCNVERLTLTGDTAQKDWAPSSGTSNYTLLNSLQNTANYVSTSDTSATDLYTISSLSYDPASVFAVQVSAQAIQTDAANITKAVAPIMQTGTTSAGAGAVVPPAAFPLTWYTEAREIMQLAPDGGVWSYSKLTSALSGIRVSPFAKGLNFRQTAAYVTDAPYNTYVINDLYPTTRGGVTFGWDSAGSGTVALNRTTALDIYAGINCQLNSGAQRTFRVDLPAAGRYAIRLILGDVGYAQRQEYAQVKDGTNVLFTLDSTTGANPFFVQTGGVLDALSDINYYYTAWPEYNEPRIITTTGTVLNVTIGSPAAGLDYSCIAHLELVALDLVYPLVSVAPPVQVDGLYIEALISQSGPLPALVPGIDPGKQARNFNLFIEEAQQSQTLRVGFTTGAIPTSLIPGIDPGRQARNFDQFDALSLWQHLLLKAHTSVLPPPVPIPHFDPGKQARRWWQFFRPAKIAVWPTSILRQPLPLPKIANFVVDGLATKTLASNTTASAFTVDTLARKTISSATTAAPLQFAGLITKRLVSSPANPTTTLFFDALVRKTLCLAIPAVPQAAPFVYSEDFGAIPIFPDLPVAFPVRVSPGLDTIVGTTKSLREMRFPQRTAPLWDIEVPFEELRDQTQNAVPYGPFVGFEQYETLVQTWLMMYGQSGVFAFNCPWDNSRTGQVIGTGDGATWGFQIYSTWGLGAQAQLLPVGYVNAISAVYVNGVLVPQARWTFSRDKLYFISATGMIYPPAAGAVISLTFSYYYLCRFVEDEQDFEEFAKNRWVVPTLKFRAVLWL